MENLAKRIEAAKNRLKKVDTRTITADGRELLEKRSKEGKFVSSQVAVRPWGFVGDFRPDLEAAEVIPGQLFMGSQDVAQELSLLQSTGITHIVNIATGIDNFFDSTFTYLKVEVLDLPSANLKKYFEQCADFIHEALDSGGKVFVHCNAGISRSSSIVIAYLMKYREMNYVDAFTTVKRARSCARPNEGFVRDY